MIPETDAMLNVVAGKMLTDIAPNMAPGYSQGSASTLAMVMILAAQEYGRAADTRAWENAKMREILSRAGIETGAPPETLNIAALNAENGKLTQSLIALHEPAYAAQWKGLDPAFQETMLGAIAVFRMPVTRLESKFKLNQHRKEAHAAMKAGYAAGNENERALARWMERLGL